MDEDGDEAASGWETASDNEDDDVVGPLPHGQPASQVGAEDWEEWDVKRSLFDNHISKCVACLYLGVGGNLRDGE